MNLLELFKRYEDNDNAIAYLESIRWPNKVICPYCNSEKIYKHHVNYGGKIRKRWQCGDCSRPFTVTVGTIFHHTHVPLNKWFWLISLMLNAKKGLSAYQAARDLGMRRPTVWSMMHRIRKAMETDEAELLKGIVEMDETYVGGKPRKENRKDKKDDDEDDNLPKRGRGTKKIPVVGMVEREGKVKTVKMSALAVSGKNLMELVRKHIDIKNTTLMTDQYKGYGGMHMVLKHKTINHSFEYVNGDTHTNTIESFWAILKRGIVGQFHKVSIKYLDNYLNEFEYRYNRRKQNTRINMEETLMRMVKI